MMRIIGEIVIAIGTAPTLSLILKATIVSLAALTAAQIARRSRASVRHLLLATSFIMLLTLPVISLVVPARDVGVSVLPLSTFGVKTADAQNAAAPDSRLAYTGGLLSMSSTRTSLWLAAPLSGVWLTGVAFSVIPMITGLIRVRRVRRNGLPWRHGQVVLGKIAATGEVRRRIELLLHETVAGPMTCGVVRPAIILPLDARAWNQEDLQRAIVHEVEHIRRADCLILYVARIVCALYWFHPLVWMSWRQLRLEAERACDDAVLRGAKPEAYAEQLVALAERLASRTTQSALAMANRGDLSARVSALLDDEQPRGRAGALWMGTASAAAVLFLTAIAPLRAVAVPRVDSRDGGLGVTFEVASIKQNKSTDSAPSTRFFPGGRFTATNATLRDLILVAYGDEFARSQVTGFTGWMDETRFDVDAIAAASVAADGELTRERALVIRQMVGSLLADRFGLRVHREERSGDVHVLSVAPGGPKLPPAKAASGCAASMPQRPTETSRPALGCHTVRIGRRGFEGTAVDTADIAGALKTFLERPVIDRVRLTGLYEVGVRWNATFLSPRFNGPSDGSDSPSDDPDVYTAIREQLGLKLEIERGQIPVLVIDSATIPEAN